jgi:hypothetical protein
MNYFETIKQLTEKVPISLVDFNAPRDLARTPTQVSSNFITHNEQGAWAEGLIFKAINALAKGHVAVKYGKSDDRVAGSEGFSEFYESFQVELDNIGKRPDLLIFRKSDYKSELGMDISQIPYLETLEYVRMAIAGIEIRSSSFLIERYEAAMKIRTEKNTIEIFRIKDEILSRYSDLLSIPKRKKYLDLLTGLTPETVSILDFKVPNWGASERLLELNILFKKMKVALKEIQKRDSLSITVKVEDLKVVKKWIETFDVQHLYFQVFFDKVYGISFKNILEIISNDENDGGIFSVEENTKNQNKTTIHINSKCGIQIGYKIEEPEHKSVRKEMARGRLLFYVTFEGGTAYLDVENLMKVLNIEGSEF